MYKWFQRKEKQYTCPYCGSHDKIYHADSCIWGSGLKIGSQLRIRLPKDYKVKQTFDMLAGKMEQTKMTREDAIRLWASKFPNSSKQTAEQAINAYEALGMLKFDPPKADLTLKELYCACREYCKAYEVDSEVTQQVKQLKVCIGKVGA